MSTNGPVLDATPEQKYEAATKLGAACEEIVAIVKSAKAHTEALGQAQDSNFGRTFGVKMEQILTNVIGDKNKADELIGQMKSSAQQASSVLESGVGAVNKA